MPKVYRIIREKFKDQPLSVEGSRLYGARWNPKGIGILYTTSSPELGLVEIPAHAPGISYEFLPRYLLFEIEIPDSVRVIEKNDLPSYWQDNLYEKTQYWLKDWLIHPDTLAVSIPSVIVPFSKNILIHPGHSSFNEIKIIDRQPFPIDRRLWKKEGIRK